MADGKRSKIWIEGPTAVRVGDTIHARLQLYDGFGHRLKTGGDLVSITPQVLYCVKLKSHTSLFILNSIFIKNKS